MNKTEMIKAVAAKTSFSQKDVKEVVEAINEVKTEALCTDGIIKDGLFISKIRVTNPRNCRNPKTGEQIFVDSRKKVSTKAGAALMSAITAE